MKGEPIVRESAPNFSHSETDPARELIPNPPSISS